MRRYQCEQRVNGKARGGKRRSNRFVGWNIDDFNFGLISLAGVDLAAFEAAEACGIEIAGWVPRDFTNELGAGGIPERFRSFLWQTATAESADRTERNILEGDGILTLLMGDANSPGTQHGVDHARKLGKTDAQMLFVDLSFTDLDTERRKAVEWLKRSDIKKCAIGGPRESEAPGVQSKAYKFLLSVFKSLQQSNGNSTSDSVDTA